MIISIYTDGGSSGNPGPAASAFVILNGDQELKRHAEAIGTATNNVAEYTAFILALESLKKIIQQPTYQGITKIELFSDSLLMVRQLQGVYKIKEIHIKKLIGKIRSLESEINCPFTYTHIPREKNKVADGLVREILY